MNLAHNLGDVREGMRRVYANRLNGVDAEWLDARRRRSASARSSTSRPTSATRSSARPTSRAAGSPSTTTSRGATRAAADASASTSSRAPRSPAIDIEGGRVDRRPDRRAARSRAGKVAIVAAGHASIVAGDGRDPAAAPEPPAPGARVGAARADPPDRRHVERRPRLRQPGAQGRAGDGRRHRRLQRLRPARRVPRHRAPDGGGPRALPDLRAGPRAADLGRHRRRVAGRLADHLDDRRSTACTSTAAGAPAGSRRRRRRAGCSPTRSPTTSRTRSTGRSRWSGSRPARSSTSTAPRRSPTDAAAIPCPYCGPRDETEFRYGGQAGIAYPADPDALTDAAVGRVPVPARQPQGSVRASAGSTRPAAGAGSTSPATR